MFRLSEPRFGPVLAFLPRIFLCLIISFFCVSSLLAEDQSSTKKGRRSILNQLENVRAKIEREKRRLDNLKNQRTTIVRESKEIGKLISASQKEKDQLVGDIEKLTGKAVYLVSAIEKATGSAQLLRVKLKRRIVAIYKTQRRSSSLDYLLRASSSLDFLRRTYYLGVISRHDQSEITRLSNKIANLKKFQNELQTVRKRKEHALSGVEKLSKQLEQQHVKKASLLLDKKEKAKQAEKTLVRLNESAVRLESVLTAIMGGEGPIQSEDTEESEEKPKGQDQEEVKVARTVPRTETEMEPFLGKGLARFKGKLEFPVEGETLRKFGKQRHSEFADVLFVKGLEVSAPVGSRVKAVAKGKVILSKILPGYGHVVILDHGRRYYTLYGRVSGLLCRVGEVVNRGQVLAVAGEPDHQGRNFYFELRVQGKARNPSTYFRKIPGLRKKLAKILLRKNPVILV